MKKFILTYIAMLFCAQLLSQNSKDTIFFINGTMVIGELKKVKLGVVTFNPDDANDITVQLRKVRTISGYTKVFRVETITHDVYYGKLVSSDSLNYTRLDTGAGPSLLMLLENISVLYPFENSFKERFSGSVGLGYSYTRSSNFGRANYDGRLSYSAKREELTLSVSGVYTITDSSFSRDHEDYSLKNNYYFSPTWFGTMLLAYQRNIELGLQRRYQEGLGAGNKFFTNKYIYAWVRSGVVFNQEISTEQVSSGTLTEVFAQLEFNLFRFTKPEIKFNFAQTFYYSLSQKDRFRSDGDSNLSWEIFNDFNLTLTFYTNYDSKPPVPEYPQFDYGIVFGVSYSF